MVNQKFSVESAFQEIFERIDNWINPIQAGNFGGCSRMVGGEGGGGGKRYPLSKICHTYPTMMKLGNIIPYLKKIKKIYKSHETLPEFC